MLRRRARTIGRSRRHSRPARRCAGRHALCEMGGARRSADRDQFDAEPAGCRGRPRRCARSRCGRPRPVEDAAGHAGRGSISLPGESEPRFHRGRQASRTGLCAAARARRQERAEPRMAAEAIARHRPAADQCTRRHHQFPDDRSRPAAACLRRGQGHRRSQCAPRPRRRKPRRARRQDLSARRKRHRHRR